MVDISMNASWVALIFFGLIKIKDHIPRCLKRQANARELPTALRIEEVSIAAANMTSRRDLGTTAKNDLTRQESTVVMACFEPKGNAPPTNDRRRDLGLLRLRPIRDGCYKE
jgi:hypothetical protein